jgi:hypothetical protein
MKLEHGHYRYAVAIRDSGGLWLTLWVHRKPNGDILVAQRRPAQRLKFSGKAWNPHASYHRDGIFHWKSYDEVVIGPEKRQPLTGPFRGTEHLGLYGGHGTGIPCDSTRFTAVVEVASSLLGQYEGMAVSVDLAQPGIDPIIPLAEEKMIQRSVFTDFEPWVVIRIWSLGDAVT